MRVIVDIETDGLTDIKHIWCVVTRCIDTGKVLTSTNFEDGHAASYAVIREARELVGHNIIGFDLPVLASVGVVPSPDCILTDTLVASRVVWSDIRNDDFKRAGFPKEMAGSHSLKAWGTRLGVHKDEYGESADWSRWDPQMQTYCEQDTAVTRLLYQAIVREGYPDEVARLERHVACITKKMEQRGWRFDSEAADRLTAQLQIQRNALHDVLVKTFPPKVIVMKTKTKKQPFNPGSRQDIARVLTEMYGWQPVEVTPQGQPKIDETVLSSLQYPEAKLLCEYLMIVKRLGQLAEGDEAWTKLVKNGRLHGYINTGGTVTGRATHSRPNISQVPASRSPWGTECRSLFTTTDGMVLVGCDASGLELRCLAHFLARYDGGKYAKVILEGDVHWENAIAFGLVKAGTKRDKDDAVLEAHRNTAKTLIYAMIYGAGDTKLGSTVGSDERKGAALRKRFEANVPSFKLLKEAVAAAGKRGYLIGLDGRRLPIRSPHAALNTLLQSAGALVMKKALCLFVGKLDEEGREFGKKYAIVGWIHDEFQIEVQPALVGYVGEAACASIAAAGEYYGFRIPLAGEWRSGASWGETH